MYTTIVYLNEEDIKKLTSGEKFEIQINTRIRNSDRLILRMDQTDKKEKE